MTKVKLQTLKQNRDRKGAMALKTKAKLNSRERVLSKQLNELGKVGGLIDKRFGVIDSSISSSDASFRRHVLQKILQIKSMGMVPADDDDPLTKTSRVNSKTGNQASFDDDLGDLSAEIVNSELFGGGLLTAVDATDSSRQNKHDSLLEKIAHSKEERLKRVELNEANRQKLQDADSEWSDKIRFMLSKLSELKPKTTEAAKKMKKGRSEVLRLLESYSLSKTVAPIGAYVETETDKNNRLFANLHSIVVNKAELENVYQVTAESSKREDILLRLLCHLKTCEPIIVSRIAEDLQSLAVTQLPDVVRGLFLVQILLTDVISRKVESEQTKFADRARLNGIFIPEAVRFLTRLIDAACKKDGLFSLPTDAYLVDNSVYDCLNTRVALNQKPILENESSAYRIGCLKKCLSLTNSFLEVYVTHFPAPAVCQIFSRLSLDRLNLEFLPLGITTQVQQLCEKLSNLRKQPRPTGLVTMDKISLVLAEKNSTPQDLQKAGLVPQLEPDFEEKLAARRSKKLTTTVLKQKLKKERRGIVRELRKDSRFMADYERKKTKANDDIRKKKTQAIIASIRSVE